MEVVTVRWWCGLVTPLVELISRRRNERPGTITIVAKNRLPMSCCMCLNLTDFFIFEKADFRDQLIYLLLGHAHYHVIRINLQTKINEPPRGKTNNVVSEHVRHKLGCTSTEDG